MGELAASIQTFRSHLLEANILDPEGVHHELSGGMHGRKLDFDTIPTYNENQLDFSPLYNEWVQVTADFIYSESPDALELITLGVANGTNRLAEHTAKRIGKGLFSLNSKKDDKDPAVLYLPSHDRFMIAALMPDLVVVTEDVGTTGSNSVQVARQAQDAGARQVVVVNTWQRRERLELLDEAGIEYKTIIEEPLPTYSRDDCLKTGLCAQGWKLIPRPEHS